MSAFAVLPRSWWQTYTEALCNSRGYKTSGQVTRERFSTHAKLKRAIELAVVRNSPRLRERSGV